MSYRLKGIEYLEDGEYLYALQQFQLLREQKDPSGYLYVYITSTLLEENANAIDNLKLFIAALSDYDEKESSKWRKLWYEESKKYFDRPKRYLRSIPE